MPFHLPIATPKSLRRQALALVGVTVALVAIALSATAQPASAALAETVSFQGGSYRTCSPDYQAGVQGQYGAWGNFIDGCTVQVTCYASAGCQISGRSLITTESYSGHRVTLNTRIRKFNSSGSLYGWLDKSCEGINHCRAEHTTTIQYQETATVQCNGVRESLPNRARARCQLILTYAYCSKADVAVTSLSQADAEAAVLCVTNQERAKYGLAALTPNYQLGNAARGHAAAAVANPWWTATSDSHRNPYTGSTPSSRIAAAGYCAYPKHLSIAENTYTAGPNPTPRQAVNWWMTHAGWDGTLATNGHRKNILSTARTELGVGVVLGSASPDRYAQSGTFVQDFGTCINY